MKILLASNASWKPPKGGSTRANRVWIDALRAKGHECRIAAPGALDVASLTNHIREYGPDWVLVSSEDLGQVLLKESLDAAPDRAVYLAHTPQMFPFGPASLNANRAGTELVRRCAAVVAIGAHTAEYIRQHAHTAVDIVHPPMYGAGPYSNDADRSGLIGFINPCAVKGLSIFLGIARSLPRYRFAVLPGWGTTATDRLEIAKHENVDIDHPVPDISDWYRRMKLLLVPSLWPEGFGLVVTEAMLHGIPVLTSNLGGLVEAKQGTDYIFDVNPIRKYEAQFDEHLLPVPIVPEQDLRPWLLTVRELMEEPDAYETASRHAFEAAVAFVSRLDAGDLERLLLRLKPGQRTATAEGAVGDLLGGLSPERRALLAKLVKQRRL